jgi:hypothetical protein
MLIQYYSEIQSVFTHVDSFFLFKCVTDSEMQQYLLCYFDNVRDGFKVT